VEVTFLGTGEAFDHARASTSLLVHDAGAYLLLDCGYSAVRSFWRLQLDPDVVKTIFISHHHADHYAQQHDRAGPCREGQAIRERAGKVEYQR
jgi:ribonuclease BN (tRNA processing enzyme)